MQLQKAQRVQSKIKLSLAGASGSGKTYSALLLAYGLCNDWSKIAVLDTENYSASLYAHLGGFYIGNIFPPFHPEKYIEAIHAAEAFGIEVIIIDSITHEWSGKGGCLDLHEQETSKMRIPNSFTAWAAITPRHQAFVDAIVNSSCHIISTVRSKTEYVLTERNGKQVPQKLGMSPITRDGFEYDVTIHFELDQQHKAFCTKDRTGLFMDKDPFIINADTGRKILQWCNEGEAMDESGLVERINGCKSIKELLDIYHKYPQFQQTLTSEFESKKRKLMIHQNVQSQLSKQPIHSNGQQ